MQSFRAISLLIGGALLAACVANPPLPPGFSLVSLDVLVENPQAYHGKRIRVEGWAVTGFEDYNLYRSKNEACSGGVWAPKVGADWNEDILPYRSMRRGIFDATFKNWIDVVEEDGSILISSGMSSPGPLEDIEVVRWTSKLLPYCG